MPESVMWHQCGASVMEEPLLRIVDTQNRIRIYENSVSGLFEYSPEQLHTLHLLDSVVFEER